MKGTDFDSLYKRFSSELKDQTGDIASFVVNFLNSNVPHYNWVGIYVIEGDDLVLRAYSGPKETEHTRIKVGDGICGLAAKEELTVVVPDVSKDSRYIACFPETKSEIVAPIFKDGKVTGEIDIDSDYVDPFSNQDKHFLDRIINLIGRRI
ncbi:MAG: GAF domain-containing protein [Candidatus Thermoplasmatota archaeon]|nr:GAF domain-containing protein [Candidatus Thermoplasmatota archaeon]MCL5789135.1 GAF domain-containing protein [Candidatus Thermoplasmatota archaeon]